MPGWTDSRFFYNIANIKTISGFGPGLLTVTHSPKEYVDIKALIDSVKIFSHAALNYRQ